MIASAIWPIRLHGAGIPVSPRARSAEAKTQKLASSGAL
jgi:hypothetical protein